MPYERGAPLSTEQMADGLLEAVRGLHLAHPELGPKPLLAKLRQQQPDLAVGNKEVREALAALKAEESKPAEAAAAAPPVVDESRPQPDVAISLACFGCARLPSEMGDGREKHPVCPICRELKIPTTYWCDVSCPGNPAAWKKHTPVHKAARKMRERSEDGGEWQQRARAAAEEAARDAARTGDTYGELLAKGMRSRLMQEKASQRIFFSFQLHPRPQHPPSSMVELLHHKRASQGRATSSVDQPCH